MGSLVQAKSLGGIGSLLLVLSVIPSAGPILGIIGFILVLIAVKNISEAVGNKAIYDNALISIILGIVGLVVGLVVGVAGFLSFFGAPRFFQGPFEPPFERGFQPGDFMGPGFISFILAIIAGLLVIWATTIASAVYLRRSFTSIASALNIKQFSTAATLYLIGAVLVVVLVGFIIIFIAAIIQTLAFFSIPEQPTKPPPPPPSVPT